MWNSLHRSHAIIAVLLWFGHCMAVVHLFLHLSQPEVRNTWICHSLVRKKSLGGVIISGSLGYSNCEINSKSCRGWGRRIVKYKPWTLDKQSLAYSGNWQVWFLEKQLWRAEWLREAGRSVGTFKSSCFKCRKMSRFIKVPRTVVVPTSKGNVQEVKQGQATKEEYRNIAWTCRKRYQQSQRSAVVETIKGHQGQEKLLLLHW